MNLIGRLNALAKRVETAIPSINWGGCCVFAALIAERLGQHIPVRIRVGGSFEDDVSSTTIDQARQLVQRNIPREWNRNGVQFAHVVVEFDLDGKTFHYDTNGVKPAKKYTHYGKFELYQGSLRLKEAFELTASGAGWNSMFLRSHIPQAERLISEAFDRIDKVSPPVKPRFYKMKPGQQFGDRFSV